MPLTWSQNEIFSAQHNRLIVGFVMGTKFFKISTLFVPVAAVEECTGQQIFTDFENPFSNDHIKWTFSKIPKPRINSLVCSSISINSQLRDQRSAKPASNAKKG